MENDTTVSAAYIFRGIEYIVTMTVKDDSFLVVEVEDKLTADQWRADFDSACMFTFILMPFLNVYNDCKTYYECSRENRLLEKARVVHI
jgi:hypothetical protein